MKAVITKSQLNRIKNFINETREIPKANVLKEYETKQGSEDFPFEIGFEFIRQNGGKDFLMSKGISKWEMFKNAIIKNKITRSDIEKFKNANDESIFDKYFGKQLPMNEKKYTDAQMRAFDKDKNGIPFQDKDWEMIDEDSDCGCGEDNDDTRYMFFSNLEQMMRQARMLLQMDEDMIEDLLNNGHDWAADHIAEAKNNMDQVFDFIMNEMNGEGEDDSWGEEEDDEEEREMVYEGMSLKKKEQILEAVYQGRKVQLGKPFLTPDGPKKRSVYVRNDKGNVVKVNFGDPNMKIKKNIPARRKSFRARHNCANPGPKWKSRYWSCKAW